MKLEPVLIPEAAGPAQDCPPSMDWPLVAVLTLSAVFWLLAWYEETVASMVVLWRRSETYAHGFLIFPIALYLVWRKRHVLAALAPSPDFAALPLLAAMGFAWLLGKLAGAGVVQQYSLIAMIALLVWAILGRQVALTLAFALFFLVFAVPFGDFLLPAMMEHTADFTVSALRLSGIPVYQEGLFFTLPTGSWSVVEACSGLRYLIASLTVGFLYAYLNYRSLWRRAVFIALSVIVPVVANWLRAYMIVLIGHLSDMKLAVGIDHIIYGWAFFGVVTLILFWLGSFWQEDRNEKENRLEAPTIPSPGAPLPLAAIMGVTLAAAAIVAIWPAAAAYLDLKAPTSELALQVPRASGSWEPVQGQLAGWIPHFLNPRARVNQVYGKDRARVGLYIGYYADQRQGVELITALNGIVSATDREWRKTGEAARRIALDNRTLSVVQTQIRSLRGGRLLTWHWYWVDGRYTTNEYFAKLLQAKSRLLGHGDDSAVVIVYAPYQSDSSAAAKEMRDFLGAALPAIGKSLSDAR